MTPEAQQQFAAIVRGMHEWLHARTELPSDGATLEQLHWIRRQVAMFIDTIPVRCHACDTLYQARNVITDEAGVTFCHACWERDQSAPIGRAA